MSHPRFHPYPYFTGTLMTGLGWDVLMVSDGLSAFCFMGVSAFGFGGLAVSLLLGISIGTDTLSSLTLEVAFAVGVVRALPGIGSVSGILCSSCVVVLAV